MKLWVDDMKDPRGASQFGDWPDGPWQWEKDAMGARSWLFHPKPENRPTTLALDNDLGIYAGGDGRDIAHQILDRVLDDPDYVPPAVMRCISFNPVAEREINSTFDDIRKALKARG